MRTGGQQRPRTPRTTRETLSLIHTVPNTVSLSQSPQAVMLQTPSSTRKQPHKAPLNGCIRLAPVTGMIRARHAFLGPASSEEKSDVLQAVCLWEDQKRHS